MEGSDVFVAPAVTASYTGFVEAHNALAQKLVDLQKNVESVKEAQEQGLVAAKEQLAKDQEQQLAQVAAAEDARKKAEENFEAFKAQFEERFTACEQKQSLAVKDFTDAIDSKLQALQHSLDEVTGRQAEIITRVMPKWEADTNNQVKKVAAELSSHTDRFAEQTRKFEDSFSAQTAALDALHAALLQRFSEGFASATARADAAEGRLDKVGEEIKLLESNRKEAEVDLRKQLSLQYERLEVLAKSEANAVSVKLGEDHGLRLTMLEGVMKQIDFERLKMSQLLEKELEKLRAELDTRCNDVMASSERQSAQFSTEFSRFEQEQRSSASQVKSELLNSYTVCERRMDELTLSLTATENKLRSEDSSLRERFDVELRRVEDRAKEEATSVLELVRSDEGARLKVVESKVADAELQRRALNERINQEEAERKTDAADAAAVSDKRISAFELLVSARIESFRQALDGLATEFQGYVRLQGMREMDTNRLESLVRALEVRVWPWRHNAKDRPDRDRSSSPPPSSQSKAHVLGIDQDWHTLLNIRSPKKPGGSRPGSATYRRGGRDAAPREEKDMSGLQMHGSPVGTGTAVARASRTVDGIGTFGASTVSLETKYA